MAVHPGPHDPVITVDAEGNYVKTTCRDCGAELGESERAVAAAIEAGILEEPIRIEEGDRAWLEDRDGETVFVLNVPGVAEEDSYVFDASQPNSTTNVPPGDHDNPLAEGTDAAEEGLEPGDGEPEHPDGDGGGETAEAGSGDSPVDSPPLTRAQRRAAARAEAKREAALEG